MLSKAIIATFLAASAVAFDLQPLARACDRDDVCVASAARVEPAERVNTSSDHRAAQVADLA